MTCVTATVECPACGLTVPDDRAADLATPYGPVTVCKSCHPDGLRGDTPTGGDSDG